MCVCVCVCVYVCVCCVSVVCVCVFIRNLAVFSVQFELARVTFAVAVGVITAIVLAYVHV